MRQPLVPSTFPRALTHLLPLLALGLSGCGEEPLAAARTRDRAPSTTAERSAAEGTALARTTPWFVDATAPAGLTWSHREGGEQWDIRPTMGPGAAFADGDGDGDNDLFVVGGRDQACAFFVNDGSARFSDRATAWGLSERRGSGMGAVFADWDDDGDADLYVTYDGPNAAWRNDGERFADVTAIAGTGHPGWSASAAFADYDRDGDLDLFVTNYLEFDLSRVPPESKVESRRREDPIAMLPYVFPGQADVLYRNEGAGRFQEVTAAAGLADPNGKGLGALFLDYDDDLLPDLYVANDTTPNRLWHNRGDGTFEDVALFVGLDDPRGGMGLEGADFDEDGDEDIFLTNWQLETNALYRNNHLHAPTRRRFVPRFEDVALAAGLAQTSVGSTGWGCLLADLDNDGDRDLVVANGYTSPDYETTMTCVGQPDHLYENVTGPTGPIGPSSVPRFRLLPPEEAGPPFARALPSRGLAGADADGDGDLDLVITANCGPLVFLRNESGGRSLAVIPEGDADAGTRDAVGARVSLLLDDGSVRVAWVRAGSSYLAQHEPGVRFGLGERRPVEVRVRWPDGSESNHPAEEPGVLRPVQGKRSSRNR